MQYDVFISYSSKDSATAQAICHELEDNHIRCWMAPRDIPAGSKYASVITEAIKSSKAVVLVFSERSAVSPWVESEIHIAYSNGKPIIPYKIDKVHVEDYSEFYIRLHNRHWIEAYPDFKTRFAELVGVVSKIVNPHQGDEGKKGEESPLPSTPNKVDLGLSVCWSDRNVGASTPEGYGDYFAWGETDPKSEYTKEDYKYYDKDKEDYIDIGEEISDTEYDVARVKWGEGWRMPTGDEIEELRDKCQWVWCEKNGVNGRLITGPNGNSIFLPAAGASEGHWKNVKGRYWTGTKRSSGEADRICFGENSYMWMSWSNYCYWGCTIRPVMAKSLLLQTDKSQENAPALSQQNHMGEYPKSLKFSYEGQEFYMVLSPDRTYYMGNIKAVGQDFSWLDSSWLLVGGGAAIAASAVALGILAWPMAIVLFLRAVSGWSNGKDKNNHTDCIKVNESLCNELSKSSGYKFAKPTEEELEGVTQEEKPFCVVLRVTDNPNLTLAQENS